MLPVGATRRADASRRPPLDGRRIRREQAVRRADLVSRLGVRRPLAKLCGTQAEGCVEIRTECGDQPIGGIEAWSLGPRLAEIVLDGDRALLEEQLGPDGRGREAIEGRATRVVSGGFSERSQRFGVVEVVAEVQRRNVIRRARRCRELAASHDRRRQHERQYSDRPSTCASDPHGRDTAPAMGVAS